MEKRSASFFIHRQHHSHEETLAWLDQARIGWENLNGDGRYILLQILTLTDRWDGALELVHTLTDEDLEETPALNLLAAIISLASQTPADLRHILIAGAIPMNPRGFPIADTPSALVERRAAEQYFRKAADALLWAGNTVGARQFAAMALWLKLRDPAAADSAAREVGDALDEPDRAITILPLALDFDLPLNLEEVERSLGALEALNPAGDFDFAFARLFLTQSQGSLAEQHAYFQRHRAMLHRHLAVLGLTDFEIRLLIHDGRSEKAREVLAAVADKLDPADVQKFQDLISAGPGGRSLAALETDYLLTPGLPTLGRLVEALIPEGFSERLFGLWRQMVKTTQVQTDAETLVRFLIQNHRWAEIDQVLADTSTLADGSVALQSALAWSHFRAGRFNEARSVLADLRRAREDANDRALHVNLVIASGRWPELVTFVEQEWNLKDQRSAEEVLGVAELASRIGSPRLADLLEQAASLEPENPHILIACYSLAVRSGIEALSQTHGWLETAIRTSDEDGPVQSADLKTLIDQAPEWDARVDQISDQLRRGELPMAIAAPGLRRSPLEMQLVPMLANPGQSDPRRRSVVPAYSGVRSRPELTAARIGLDLTAIVTLAVLDLLDPIIAQGGVTIAHGTLRHLFEDRQKLAFHQPSRIQFAHALTRWMATGKLQRFTPTAEAAPGLIGVVGHGLAEMLAEAMDQNNGAAPRRYVIRSNPVQKMGSFSGEAVDLDDYHDVLRGCGAVLEKLQDSGLLTGGEYSQARAYLDHQGETPWRDGEDIDSGSDLFLDDLSVDYLNTMGVLDRLGAAGVRAFVSAREIGEANAFLELEARSDEIERVIERMRANLSGAIETGQVSVSSEADEIELPRIGEVFQTLPPLVDALVCDDRFLNQHPVMSTPDGQTPIWTSLDLIDRLQHSGVISESERSTYRMTLRRGGLAVFPLEANELADHVAAARVKDGKLVENGELRAFRENLSLSQMRGWLRLPQEWGWLANVSSALLDLITRQWGPEIPDEDSRGRSEWLFELADLRNWAGCFDEGSGLGMAEHGRVQQVVKLVIGNIVSEDLETNKRYAWWLENIVSAIQQAEPALYGWILTSLRDLVLLHQEREAGDDA